MIEIADQDVPVHAAPLTVPEVLEGLRHKTIVPERCDLIIELRNPTTRVLSARMWLGKDGVIMPEGLQVFAQAMSQRDRVEARILLVERNFKAH